MAVAIPTVLQIFRINQNQNPNPTFSKLAYSNGIWILYDYNGKKSFYNESHIAFDAGIFCLLELKNEKKRQIIIVFSDQITDNLYRHIKLSGLNV
ncbi:hypothetical protein QM427_09840 [Tatlockia sp. PL877]|nr:MULTISPECIES: hypothetical protein [unclassified Legionella]MDI9819454.1 hypothetical protein [Legionella sp. PL877]